MKRFVVFLALWAALLAVPPLAQATNGDNLIAVGTVARMMGGVGIAAPQDAIGAVFSNPAAMCFTPFCPSSEVDIMGTIFVPNVSSKINSGGVTYSSHSKEHIYPIPAMGISFGFLDMPKLRFGLGAYGVSGLGVDYKGKTIDQNNFFGTGAPLGAGLYTDLMIMKFAPSVAWQATDWLSIGGAFHVDYSTLDLRQGMSYGYGFGAQFGAIIKPMDQVSIGINYVTPQPIKYGNVADFNGDGASDNLTLESPNQLGAGVAWESAGKQFLIEGDVKWINWSGAQGYKEFDWSDQWVVALGAQYRPIQPLALRVGWNYGQNPVKKHNNWDGTGYKSVQGVAIPRYYYESFRVIGFPAIVEHHLTAGVAYDLTEKFTVHLGYAHAFENTLKEHGTNLAGQPASLQSSLSENSYELGLTWRF